MKTLLILAVLAGHASQVAAVCPTWPTAERFSINGELVTDRRNGLIWARCSVGQSWDGSTCTGDASAMKHEAAMRHAADQNGWRLPTARELSSLTDKGCSDLTIDSVAFPRTRPSWYWTSTPYASNSHYSWLVDFEYGYLKGLYSFRSHLAYVRLVRVGR